MPKHARSSDGDPHYISAVRALVLSHVYSEPSKRQKLRELAGLGWTITLALPGGTTDMDGAIRLAPVPVTGSPEEPHSLKWSGRALRRLLTDIRPDIVHVEEEPESPAAFAMVHEALKLEIPSVVFSWRSLPRRYGFMERRRRKRTLAEACGVIGGNRIAEGLLAEAADGVPTMSLPQNGVTPPPVIEREPRQLLSLACVGRLVPERGVDMLLRACGQLMGPWQLVVAGTGPEQEELEEQAERLGLAARIRWMGPVSRTQITALWPEIDCLVVPSRSTPTWTEPYSPVLIDAMANGVAGVVTAEGALPELVGDAGIVTRSDEELLTALQELIATPSRRTELGQAARLRVLERYSNAAIARKTAEFWSEVVARTKDHRTQH
jgi:glycosyltransferase involved in cell wall biosynthesis